MAAQIDISLDLRNLARFRTLLKVGGRKAASQALYFTAERAVPDWQAANRALFHMRRDWINKGVRARFVRGQLSAQVGTIDKYMGRHTKGVEETKRAGGKALFVPAQPVEEQGTHTQIRGRLRGYARSKTKVMFWQGGRLFRREGKGKAEKVKLLAVLRQAVRIKPRLDAVQVVSRAVNREFPTQYERLLLKALDRGG